MSAPSTASARSARYSSGSNDVDPNTDIFGVPLVRAMKLEEGRTLMPSQQIPTVLDLILCNLESKGMEAEVLLNANPDSPAVNKMRDDLSRGILPASLGGEPDVLVGLLRRYLRELPEPLIPIQHYKIFMDTLISSKKFKGIKDKGGVKILREVVEDKDYSKVHYHTLRRILTFLYTVLNSWWSDTNTSNLIVDALATSILRPDNLLRQVNTKEQSQLRDAVTTLITHCSAIFVITEVTDTAARRQSMIRKGERASRLQLDIDGIPQTLLGVDSARTKRLSHDPAGNLDSRPEIKALQEALASTQQQVTVLQAEIGILKSQMAQLLQQRQQQESTPSSASINVTTQEEVSKQVSRKKSDKSMTTKDQVHASETSNGSNHNEQGNLQSSDDQIASSHDQRTPKTTDDHSDDSTTELPKTPSKKNSKSSMTPEKSKESEKKKSKHKRKKTEDE